MITREVAGTERTASVTDAEINAEAPNGEVMGASRPAGEASSAEGATSPVVLGTDSKGEQ